MIKLYERIQQILKSKSFVKTLLTSFCLVPKSSETAKRNIYMQGSVVGRLIFKERVKKFNVRPKSNTLT